MPDILDTLKSVEKQARKEFGAAGISSLTEAVNETFGGFRAIARLLLTAFNESEDNPNVRAKILEYVMKLNVDAAEKEALRYDTDYMDEKEIIQEMEQIVSAALGRMRGPSLKGAASSDQKAARATDG